MAFSITAPARKERSGRSSRYSVRGTLTGGDTTVTVQTGLSSVRHVSVGGDNQGAATWTATGGSVALASLTTAVDLTLEIVGN